MVVCDILIGVEGNPRMKALGENMKSMLECQCCVFYTLICISVCVCVCDCLAQTTTITK